MKDAKILFISTFSMNNFTLPSCNSYTEQLYCIFKKKKKGIYYWDSLMMETFQDNFIQIWQKPKETDIFKPWKFSEMPLNLKLLWYGLKCLKATELNTKRKTQHLKAMSKPDLKNK